MKHVVHYLVVIYMILKLCEIKPLSTLIIANEDTCNFTVKFIMINIQYNLPFSITLVILKYSNLFFTFISKNK